MTSDDLEMLLERAAHRQEQLEDFAPQEIKIAKNARAKASPTIGRIVAEEGGSALEWYSLMVAKKGDPEVIVRDIILPAKQDVTGAHVSVSGEEIAKLTASSPIPGCTWSAGSTITQTSAPSTLARTTTTWNKC